LVDIVSKGGNYLLNVGPTSEGVIPQPSQDVLRTVGRWLQVNGEAVYGAGPTPFGEELGEPSARGAKDVRGDLLVYPQTQWRATATRSSGRARHDAAGHQHGVDALKIAVLAPMPSASAMRPAAAKPGDRLSVRIAQRQLCCRWSSQRALAAPCVSGFSCVRR